MLNLGRILLVLLFLLGACEGDDSATQPYVGPVGGSDAAVALPDATVGVDAAPPLGFDAGPGPAPTTDAAIVLDTGAPVPMPDSGAVDGGGSDAAAGDAAQADAGADAADDAAAPVEAGPPAEPGPSVARTVTVGGVERTFVLYIPKSAVKETPVPLVSVHHGFTMTGKIMEEISAWKKIAEREAIVVAFPDGLDPPWNVGENVCGLGALVSAPADRDDFGFVKAIIASAEMDQAIKKDAVFVGGFSMGGYFANHAACMGRDFVRAAAGHSSGTFDGTCPGQPIPMLLIHGDADGLIDYECSVQSRGYWVARNGCSAQVTTETIKGGECEWQQGCPAGREVGFCTLNGMDHGWAGAATSGPGAWLSAALGINGNLDYGGGVEFEDAAEMMWKFFKKYR